MRCGLGNSFPIETCGPGREGVARWIGRNRKPERPVLLVGLAGALVDGIAIGDVFEADAVLAAGGKRIETTWRLPRSLNVPMTQVTSKTRAVTSRPAKRALHAVTNAQLVDMESQAFAAMATDLGWEFGIIRAISDGLDDPLPPGCDHWVDHHGRAAKGAIAMAILRSPKIIGRMRTLQRSGEHALTQLAKVLEQLDCADTKR